MPRAQLLSEVEKSLIKELKKKLIDDGITCRDWLERQIWSYLTGPVLDQRKNQQ